MNETRDVSDSLAGTPGESDGPAAVPDPSLSVTPMEVDPLAPLVPCGAVEDARDVPSVRAPMDPRTLCRAVCAWFDAAVVRDPRDSACVTTSQFADEMDRFLLSKGLPAYDRPSTSPRRVSRTLPMSACLLSGKGGGGGETRASRARTGGENVPSLYTAVFARLDSIDPLMAPGFHSARSFFGAGFRSTRDRSSGSWWRSKDGSGTVGGDGFGTEGDEDGGEDGRGRSGSRCPWKGGRRAVAAEVPVADFGPEEERYACVNLNARDAPPPVTPQVMRWAEDVRRERRESRVVGKLRLPPPVTTGVLKWAVEANERGEGTVLGPGLFRDLHYYRELCGSIWYIDARPRRSRGSDAKIRRRAGSAPSTPLGRARGRLRTVPEASNEEEGGEESDGTSAGGVSDAAGSARRARPRTV
eukprot:jgi/Mesvir1/1322/Mv04919-RA.1